LWSSTIFCKDKKALAFSWDSCCHLLALWLIMPDVVMLSLMHPCSMWGDIQTLRFSKNLGMQKAIATMTFQNYPFSIRNILFVQGNISWSVSSWKTIILKKNVWFFFFLKKKVSSCCIDMAFTLINLLRIQIPRFPSISAENPLNM
jgi:hypothetical protein